VQQNKVVANRKVGMFLRHSGLLPSDPPLQHLCHQNVIVPKRLITITITCPV